MEKEENKKAQEKLPDRVSWQVVDAWNAIPPCDPSSSQPYCHVQCPYFYECYPEEFEEFEEYEE